MRGSRISRGCRGGVGCGAAGGSGRAKAAQCQAALGVAQGCSVASAASRAGPLAQQPCAPSPPCTAPEYKASRTARPMHSVGTLEGHGCAGSFQAAPARLSHMHPRPRAHPHDTEDLARSGHRGLDLLHVAGLPRRHEHGGVLRQRETGQCSVSGRQAGGGSCWVQHWVCNKLWQPEAHAADGQVGGTPGSGRQEWVHAPWAAAGGRLACHLHSSQQLVAAIALVQELVEHLKLRLVVGRHPVHSCASGGWSLKFAVSGSLIRRCWAGGAGWQRLGGANKQFNPANAFCNSAGFQRGLLRALCCAGRLARPPGRACFTLL